MGCLVDKFYIKLKPAWEAVDDFNKIYEQIPPEYHPMFGKLWNEFHNLEDIMSHENVDALCGILAPLEKDGVFFFSRYREDCLSQFLRKTFFDTVMIVSNQYNERKLNIFIVLKSSSLLDVYLYENQAMNEHDIFDDQTFCKSIDIINEEIWTKELPDDQKFVQSAIDNLVETDITVLDSSK
jgi:hypothetical protein